MVEFGVGWGRGGLEVEKGLKGVGGGVVSGV